MRMGASGLLTDGGVAMPKGAGAHDDRHRQRWAVLAGSPTASATAAAIAVPSFPPPSPSPFEIMTRDHDLKTFRELNTDIKEQSFLRSDTVLVPDTLILCCIRQCLLFIAFCFKVGARI